MTKPKNLLIRYCQNCGNQLAPRSAHNAKYCGAVECQKARVLKNTLDWRAALNKGVLKICNICGQEFKMHINSKPNRKTCYSPECIRENQVRAYKRFREKYQKKFVELQCLCCDRVFKTPLVGAANEHKVPRFRLCSDCRRNTREELSYAECWG